MTTAYELMAASDFGRLEMAAFLLAAEADPAAASDPGARIYEALVEALRHVEVSA